MSENKRTWNDKIKLILSELECKINEENTRKTSKRQTGADRKKQKFRNKNYSTNDVVSEEPESVTFKQEIIMQAVMSVAFLLATLALVRGVVRVLPGSVAVSNSVNGRELPIYCVETDKKQVALSFDAAWGNCI